MITRGVIADDHPIFLEGICSVLAAAPEIEIVGHAKDGRGAVELALHQRPDVVVMDVSMPGMNGVEATRLIRASVPRTKVLCLSMHKEASFVSAALAAGASGYLLKDCAIEDVVTAIRAIRADGAYLSPAVTLMVLGGRLDPTGNDRASGLAGLTTRERETLQLIADGHTTKHIAAKFGVSIKTVCTHREHLFAKLEIHSIAGLTKFAVRAGLSAIDRGNAA